MSKSVLISIKPQWCELIASGKKIVEVRKTRPKRETPFKCYIYCTKGRGDCLWRWNGIWYDTQDPNHRPNRLDGKVIGEFVCDEIISADNGSYKDIPLSETGLQADELLDYANDKRIYGWHISDLVFYDDPKELREFKPYNRTEDDCKYSHLGYAIPKCSDCHECYVKRPPQSWCYVEEVEQ